jgi:L-ascorbate metabolism protein UlaG (beta-lactamase superfamily)
MTSLHPNRTQGLRRERVLASARFVDGRFRNTAPVGAGLRRGSGLPVLGELVFGAEVRTPPGPLPLANPLEAWARPPESGLRATWLGHSTVLLELDGLCVLTDPVFGERVSPSRLFGPRRFHPPPASIAQLPRLDAVVISHDHYDHLDRPSVLELARREVPFVTSLGVGAHLEAWGVPPERIVELDWWESAELPGGLRITAAPSQHFSGRGLGDRNTTAWSSLVIASGQRQVFFSGDTGLTPEYAEIAARFGRFDLVMLEVGAFHPAWGDIHLGPDNALEAWRLLGGGPLLPVHWGTFKLALHAWDEPAEVLLARAPRLDVPLVMPRLGAPVEPSRFERIDPWWRSLEPAAATERALDPGLQVPEGSAD